MMKQLRLFLIAALVLSGSPMRAVGQEVFYSDVVIEDLHDLSVTGDLDVDGTIAIGTTPATTGTVRVPSNNCISWRNAANSADKCLKADATDILEYNGVDLADVSTTQSLSGKSMSGSANTFTNIPAGTALTGVVPQANGGTGQSTKTDAFDALSPNTTKGDMTVHNGSDNVRVPVGTDGDVWTADSTDAEGAKWAAPSSSPSQSNGLNNLGLAVSVSSNIITIALKQADGSTDPASGTGAVRVGLRGGTATNGNFDTIAQTAALSMTLGTTTSLGVATGTARTIYVYIFNNSGTLTLGASLNGANDEAALQSSSTTTTSGTVIYQSVALTSKPVRIIGRFKATWTTGVGWSSITEVSVAPFAIYGASGAVGIRTETALLTCSSSSAIVSQSGSWISSIGNISSGQCGITIASGVFVGVPRCNITQDSATVDRRNCRPSNNSATSVTAACWSDSGAALTAADLVITCSGPRG